MQKTLKIGNAIGTVDTYGGELISYIHNGKEILWYGDPEHWSGHAPILFPFVSALKNNTVNFFGKERTFSGKHGFARKSEFELYEITDTKAVFKLCQNISTLAFFPYNFDLLVTHEITEEGFTTEYKVVNTDTSNMVFCIGGHPGFFLDGSLEDYKIKFEKPESSSLTYTDANSLSDPSYLCDFKFEGTEYLPKYSDFDRDAFLAENLNSKKIKLVRKDNGHGVEFDFTGFPVLAVWTPPKKNSPFICLEPWHGMPAYVNETGNFEDKPYVITLEPEKSFTVGYSVKVI